MDKGSFPLSPWDCSGAEHRGRRPVSGFTSVLTLALLPLDEISLESLEERLLSTGQPGSGLLGSQFTDEKGEAQGCRV